MFVDCALLCIFLPAGICFSQMVSQLGCNWIYYCLDRLGSVFSV